MKRRYDLVAGVHYNDASGAAPTITLKGEADLADRAAAIAARFGIPVIEDGSLAEAIQNLPLDTEISEDLYRAVAVVLNQVERRLDSTASNRRPHR